MDQKALAWIKRTHNSARIRLLWGEGGRGGADTGGVMEIGWASMTLKDGNGVGSVWISVGFGSSGFGFGDDFSSTVFGFGPRNLSGSVSGLIFHPWIPNGSPF